MSLALEAQQKLVEADRDRAGEREADARDAEDARDPDASPAAGLLERASDAPAGSAREEERSDPAPRRHGNRPHRVDQVDAGGLPRHDDRRGHRDRRHEPQDEGEGGAVVTA